MEGDASARSYYGPWRTCHRGQKILHSDTPSIVILHSSLKQIDKQDRTEKKGTKLTMVGATVKLPYRSESTTTLHPFHMHGPGSRAHTRSAYRPAKSTKKGNKQSGGDKAASRRKRQQRKDFWRYSPLHERGRGRLAPVCSRATSPSGRAEQVQATQVASFCELYFSPEKLRLYPDLEMDSSIAIVEDG